jgi:hypothetical protein
MPESINQSCLADCVIRQPDPLFFSMWDHPTSLGGKCSRKPENTILIQMILNITKVTVSNLAGTYSVSEVTRKTEMLIYSYSHIKASRIGSEKNTEIFCRRT